MMPPGAACRFSPLRFHLMLPFSRHAYAIDADIRHAALRVVGFSATPPFGACSHYQMPPFRFYRRAVSHVALPFADFLRQATYFLSDTPLLMMLMPQETRLLLAFTMPVITLRYEIAAIAA